MHRRLRGAAWSLGLPAAAWAASPLPLPEAGAAVALACLGAAAWPALPRPGRAGWTLGSILLLAGFAAPAPAAAALWLAGLAVLLQSCCAGLRPTVTALSWLLVATSAALAALGRPAAAVALVALPGLGLLALQACWSRPDARRGWESVALASLLAASVAASLAFAGLQGWARLPAAPPRALAALAAATLAALACPLPAPGWMRLRGPVAAVAGHGLVGLALLNVGFLALTLAARWSLRLILAALLLWQAMVLLMEVRAVHYAAQRLRRARPAPEAPLEPVTVVVPAFDDAACLASSMAHNLAVDAPLRFLLVPAVASRDGTPELAERLAQQHPDRVRVVPGDTGSKAGDLNKAWAAVETDVVLMLDADETIEAAALRRGLAVLRADPGVGLLQGRKVSRAPDDGFLARFICAERRYSTWLDHVLHADRMGSGHFGGSAALVRRALPLALGGWTDRTLTEDIEFTLRVHLDGRWRIAYDEGMVVREADPRTLADLLRQRTRWARGWAQNVDLFLGPVLRARRRLGARRAFGLALLLLIAVSALWTTFLPATLLMRLGGVSPLLPFFVAVPLSLVLLPTRLLAYGFAALRDPVIPLRRAPARLAELALHAYLWILLGWLVQLNALYLELSRSAREWHVTGKRAPALPQPAAAAPAPAPAPQG